MNTPDISATTASITTASITIVVNGAQQPISEGMSVGSWLEDAGRDHRTVAIELNGNILPRARYSEVVLVDGDRLEVVQFVQGG